MIHWNQCRTENTSIVGTCCTLLYAAEKEPLNKVNTSIKFNSLCTTVFKWSSEQSKYQLHVVIKYMSYKKLRTKLSTDFSTKNCTSANIWTRAMQQSIQNKQLVILLSVSLSSLLNTTGLLIAWQKQNPTQHDFWLKDNINHGFVQKLSICNDRFAIE